MSSKNECIEPTTYLRAPTLGSQAYILEAEVLYGLYAPRVPVRFSTCRW